MADEKQETSSQELKNGTDAQQQQQHLKDTAKVCIENNSEEIEFNRDDARKIFIGGLREDTTKDDLDLHFGQFGEIQYINVKVNFATGRGRGFAFIVFKTMEGLENALACTNHIINDKVVDPKKAVPRQVKLFVGGLSSYLTDDDIKDYFKRYAPLVAYDMPYDDVKNERKPYCFLIFDNIQAVTEILKSPLHVIKGKQIYVRKYYRDYDMKYFLRSMRIMQESFRGGRGFLPQYGYAPAAPGYFYGGYYNNRSIRYSPGLNQTCGIPNYGAGARTNYQYGSYEPSAPRGGYGHQSAVKDFSQTKLVKKSTLTPSAKPFIF